MLRKNLSLFYFKIVDYPSLYFIDKAYCLAKILFPKNSNHGLRTLSLLVSLYFFSSKNAIFTVSANLYNSASNSATVMPNCSLATSAVRRPWRTRFTNIDKLPSTFPRSKPCSMPSARPRSMPSALAVSKA